MLRTYEIDCREVRTYDDFVAVFNRAFIETLGGRWDGNLDAFNDYLSWPEEVPYRLVIVGSDRCAQVLNYKASDSHQKELWPLLQDILVDNNEWLRVLFK